VKKIFRRLIPSFLRRPARPSSGWFGNYPDWASVSAVAEGYDAGAILEKVFSAIQKVKNGEAAFERDSVAFSEHDFEPAIAGWLKRAGEEQGKELNLVDFGGSLGSAYFQYKSLLGEIRIRNWTVVEQEHFVAKGKKHLEDGILNFEKSPATAIAEKNPGVILFFSVLPYVPNPFDLIKLAMQSRIEYIIIDRTPVIAAKTRLTLQVVPESVYKASYPAWFFNEQELVDAFRENYVLMQEFGSKFASPYTLEDGVMANWKGFVFRRK
jgi:putative methyltransferase (TIGR04325 family)